jgi:hypothetical protein
MVRCHQRCRFQGMDVGLKMYRILSHLHSSRLGSWMRCERLPREQSLMPLDPLRIQRSKYVAELISLAYILAVSLKTDRALWWLNGVRHVSILRKHISAADHNPTPSQLLKYRSGLSSRPSVMYSTFPKDNISARLNRRCGSDRRQDVAVRRSQPATWQGR